MINANVKNYRTKQTVSHNKDITAKNTADMGGISANTLRIVGDKEYEAGSI